MILKKNVLLSILSYIYIYPHFWVVKADPRQTNQGLPSLKPQLRFKGSHTLNPPTAVVLAGERCRDKVPGCPSGRVVNRVIKQNHLFYGWNPHLAAVGKRVYHITNYTARPYGLPGKLELCSNIILQHAQIPAHAKCAPS